MEQALVVYTTFPDEASAESVARGLVAGKLAACVNMIPGMTSLYAWRGAIETGREVVALIKTREGLAEAVRAAVKAAHPYETPVILFLPASGGDADTLAWLFAETGGGPAERAQPAQRGAKAAASASTARRTSSGSKAAKPRRSPASRGGPTK